MSSLNIPPNRPGSPRPATRQESKAPSPMAARRHKLAGRCSAQRAGPDRLRVHGDVGGFVADPIVRQALAERACITRQFHVDDETLQVRVNGRKLEVARDRKDLAPLYREDFVEAREIVTFELNQAPIFTADLTSSLVVQTRSARQVQTEVLPKHPSEQMVRLAGQAGLFSPLFVDAVARSVAAAVGPQPVVVHVSGAAQAAASAVPMLDRARSELDGAHRDGSPLEVAEALSAAAVLAAEAPASPERTALLREIGSRSLLFALDVPVSGDQGALPAIEFALVVGRSVAEELADTLLLRLADEVVGILERRHGRAPAEPAAVR